MNTLLSYPALGSFQSIPLRLSQNFAFDDVAAVFTLTALSAAYMFIWRDKPDPYHYTWFEKPQEKLGASGAAQQTRDIAEKLEQVVGVFRCSAW